MNFFDRTIAYFSPKRGALRAQARAAIARIDRIEARYDGAGQGRRNKYWRPTNTSANTEVAQGLAMLRARHRDMVRNNPYAARAITALQTNIVGNGIKPRAQSDDTERRTRAQKIINEWAQSTHIDVDDRHNLYGLESLATRTVIESGDALIVRIIDTDRAQGHGPRVPLKLRVLEGDYLDHTKNGRNEQPGYAVLGVQFNDSMQRTGYWLHKHHPGNSAGLSDYSQSVFTPAENVVHLYECLRPGQVRGVPRGTAALTRIKLLDDYQDARLEAQRAAACLVGVVIEPDAMPGDESNGIMPEHLEPGTFTRLRAGEDVRFSSPPSIPPNGIFERNEKQAIAVAYGLPYSVLTGDLSNVNFSSGRMGMLEFKRNIDKFRNEVLIPQLCHRIAVWFNQVAGLTTDFPEGITWRWAAPHYQMQDPSREIRPIVEQVRSGLTSRRRAVEQLGYDFDDLNTEIKQEREHDAENGLVFTTNAGVVTDQGYMQSTIIDPDHIDPDRHKETKEDTDA